MKITVDMLMSHYPYNNYQRELVEELWGDNEYLSLTDICDLDITVADKILACTRFLTARSCLLFACDCAESVLPIWTDLYPGDNRPAEAIRIARLYANGQATIEQLTAVWAAACDAARGAANDSANDAASDAAWAAARGAAWYASSDAAWAAASDAAWGAVRAAARAAVRDAAWYASSDAARGAARDAARAAARDAARDAERAKQLLSLRKYCEQED